MARRKLDSTVRKTHIIYRDDVTVGRAQRNSTMCWVADFVNAINQVRTIAFDGQRWFSQGQDRRQPFQQVSESEVPIEPKYRIAAHCRYENSLLGKPAVDELLKYKDFPTVCALLNRIKTIKDWFDNPDPNIPKLLSDSLRDEGCEHEQLHEMILKNTGSFLWLARQFHDLTDDELGKRILSQCNARRKRKSG